MAHRNGELPDERRPRLLQMRPFDLLTANRIRTVAHDDRQLAPRGRAHAVRHRVDVGVNPCADVLQVDDEHIETVEHVCGRLARVAIEREDGHTPAAIRGVRRLDHVVLEIRPEAMLRPEERRERHVGVVVQPVGAVGQPRIHRRRIAHESDAPARNQPAVDAQQTLDSWRDDLTLDADGRGCRHRQIVTRLRTGGSASSLTACARGARRRARRSSCCSGSGRTSRGRDGRAQRPVPVGRLRPPCARGW